MLKNKNAMSGIIITIILVVLSLIAIAIVWGVIGGILEEGTTSIDYSNKCFNAGISVTSLNCESGTSCIANLKRNLGSGGEQFDGVTVVFKNSTSQVESVYEGNIGTTQTVETTEMINANEVEATVYFNRIDDPNLVYNCENVATYP